MFIYQYSYFFAKNGNKRIHFMNSVDKDLINKIFDSMYDYIRFQNIVIE